MKLLLEVSGHFEVSFLLLELFFLEVDIKSENVDQDGGFKHLKHVLVHASESAEVLGVEEEVVNDILKSDEDTGSEDLEHVFGLERGLSLAHDLLEEQTAVDEDAVLDLDSSESLQDGGVLLEQLGSGEGLLGLGLGSVFPFGFAAVGALVVEDGLLLFLENGLFVLGDDGQEASLDGGVVGSGVAWHCSGFYLWSSGSGSVFFFRLIILV